MTIFLKNMFHSSFIKGTVSSLFRGQCTAQSMKYKQISFSSINSKILSRTNLLGCSSPISRYQIGSAGKATFGNIHLRSAFMSSDFRTENAYFMSTSSFHSIASKNKEKSLSNNKKNPVKTTNLINKLKLMLKQYWYIYIPVHGITSMMWFGGFYYTLKSGFDVKPYLDSIGHLEWLSHSLQKSNTGYFAIAAALYKIISPIRYAVTVGGIAVSVKILKEWGYIAKKNLTAEELRYIYHDKKDELIDKTDRIREKYLIKKFQIIRRYQRQREELNKRNQKGLKYWREIYLSRARRDPKKKNGNGRKNGIKGGIGRGNNQHPNL